MDLKRDNISLRALFNSEIWHSFSVASEALLVCFPCFLQVGALHEFSIFLIAAVGAQIE